MANKHKDNKRVCLVCGPQDLGKFRMSSPNSVGKRYLRRKCDPCRIAREKELRKENHNKRYKATRYRCLKDPWKFYKPGIVMNAGDVRLMLKDGNLPPNSLWLDPKKGTKWRVDGNTKWWLLVPPGPRRAGTVCTGFVGSLMSKIYTAP